MRCLIVDDRPAAASFWQPAFGRAGCVGELAASAEQATLAVADTDYDLVVVDLTGDPAGGQIVADRASLRVSPVAVVVLAGTPVLGMGWPLAILTPGAAIATRVTSRDEAVALLRRWLPTPDRVAQTTSVAPPRQVVASEACRSGPESGRA